MNNLSAIVRGTGEGTGVEAQLIELDIAVAADSVEQLTSRIEYAIEAEYWVAREIGKTPFADIIDRTPLEFHVDPTRPSVRSRELKLSAEVFDALTIALRAPYRGSFAVKEVCLST